MSISVNPGLTAWRNTFQHVHSPTSFPLVEQAHELDAIMTDLVATSEACGALLIVDDEETLAGEICHRIFAEKVDMNVAEAVLSQAVSKRHEMEIANYGWMSIRTDQAVWDILVIPIPRVAGHRAMSILALHEQADEQARNTIVARYLSRRPIAIGYLRLWQLDRIRSRREAVFEAMIHTLRLGVLLIDAREKVVFLNKAANAILSVENGLRLVGDVLHATNLKDSVKLRVALEHMILSTTAMKNVDRALMVAIDRSAGRPLIAVCVPLAVRDGGPNVGSVAVYLVDPDEDITDLLEPWCRLHGMTHTETRLACRLANGVTISEAAIQLRMKEQAARSALKQMFVKTGTRRQSDLIGVMLMGTGRVAYQSKVDLI